MRLLALLAVVPLLAQEPAAPPPEVDQALRERATAFLQNQVDGSFRKSIDLVAEETKDWYFASAKEKILSFKIESIEYSDQFTKANVKSNTRRTVSTMGHSFTLDTPITDRWKIEDGKWFWYKDMSVIETPFGPVPAPKPGEATPAGATTPGVPTDLSPAAVAAAGAKLTTAAAVNKKDIVFEQGTASTEEIVFHNGAPGLVRLVVGKATAMPSISLDVTETMVKPGEEVRVKVSYHPDESKAKGTTIRFVVQPFGTVYPVRVTVRPK